MTRNSHCQLSLPFFHCSQTQIYMLLSSTLHSQNIKQLLPAPFSRNPKELFHVGGNGFSPKEAKLLQLEVGRTNFRLLWGYFSPDINLE